MILFLFKEVKKRIKYQIYITCLKMGGEDIKKKDEEKRVVNITFAISFHFLIIIFITYFYTSLSF